MARLGYWFLVLFVFGLWAAWAPDGISAGQRAVSLAAWLGLVWIAIAAAPRDFDPRYALVAVGLLGLSVLPAGAWSADPRLWAAALGTWALWRGASPARSPFQSSPAAALGWLAIGTAATWAACLEPRWWPLAGATAGLAVSSAVRSEGKSGRLRRGSWVAGGLLLGAVVVFAVRLAPLPVVSLTTSASEVAASWRPLSLERVLHEAQTLILGQRTGLLATAPFFLAGWLGLRSREGSVVRPGTAWPILAGLGVAAGAELLAGASIDRGGLLSVTPALLVTRPRPHLAVSAVSVVAFAVFGAGLAWQGDSGPLARRLLRFETDRLDRLGTHALVEVTGDSSQRLARAERWLWAPARDLRIGGPVTPSTGVWVDGGSDGDWLVVSKEPLSTLDVLVSGDSDAWVRLTSPEERVSVHLASAEKRRGTPIRVRLGRPLERSALPATPAGVNWAYRLRVRASAPVLLDFVE